jgi:ArsR family transcriptional regulator
MIKNKAKLFKALGDETRLKIAGCLLHQDYCACDFVPVTKKDQTTVSRHLAILVNSGILKYTKKGRNIIYSIKDENMKKELVNYGIRKIKNCCREGD